MAKTKTIAYVRAGCIYNDSRATKEILTLTQTGYSVLVFGWDRDGFSIPKCREVFKDALNKVEFFFYNCPLTCGIGIKNITKLTKWFRWTYKSLMHENKQIDFVHACDLDAGLGAYKFCRKKKVRLVYDIYDYYIDSHTIPRLCRWFVEKKETKVINFSMATIICTEERREQIAKANPKKIVVIHNSPDIRELPECVVESDYTYCGGLSESRLIKEIVELYPQNQDLLFTIGGMGPYSELISKTANDYDNFSYVGSIPYNEVLSLEAKTMAISAIYMPTLRNHRLCAPNKFYEALALGKPIIVCRGTGIDKIVEDFGIGIVIEYDPVQFYDALRYLKANPQKCKEMGIRGRELYEKKYTWRIMESKLTSLYGTKKT